jgi:hypothetical protein
VPSISLSTVAAVAGVASAGIGAYGTIEAGQAQSKAAAYNAAVARNNQTIAEQKAQYTAEAGEAQAQEEDLQNANKEGAMRAAIAANNVDVNTGSAEDVQTSQREVDRLDTLTNLNNTLLQVYGYQTQATNYAAQSNLDTAESQQASIAGDIGGFGTLVGNASNIGFKWLQANPPQAPTFDTNYSPNYGMGGLDNTSAGDLL